MKSKIWHLPASAISKLILLSLTTSLFFPVLIDRFGFPNEIKIITYFVLALILWEAMYRGLRNNQKAALYILVVSAAGIIAALINSQNVLAILWGWWLMFRGPLIGLYCFNYSRWEDDTARQIFRLCTAILIIEIGAQVLQVYSGVEIGDHVSGTLEIWGTGHLAIVLIFIAAINFGQWVIDGKAKRLLPIILLCALSAFLAEAKIVIFSIIILSVMAGVVRLIAKRNILEMILLYGAISILALGFVRLYNQFVPAGRQHRVQSWFTREYVETYLNSVWIDAKGDFDVSRNLQIRSTWDYLKSDPIKMVFGEGLGAKTVSSSLGIQGRFLNAGEYAGFSGTSLAVILGEMGIAGLLAFMGFYVWATSVLWKILKKGGKTYKGLVTGIFFFSSLWPVWLWYGSAWGGYSVSIILYWTSFGFALGRSADPRRIRAAVFRKQTNGKSRSDLDATFSPVMSSPPNNASQGT